MNKNDDDYLPTARKDPATKTMIFSKDIMQNIRIMRRSVDSLQMPGHMRVLNCFLYLFEIPLRRENIPYIYSA